MKEKIFLIMNRHGVKNVRKTLPRLNSGEVAINLTLNLSDKFFERFIPKAEISIPDECVLEPKIEALVQSMTKEELEDLQKTVTVNIEKFEEEKEGIPTHMVPPPEEKSE